MTPLWPAEKAFGPAGVPAGETVTVLRRPMVTRPGSTKPVLGGWPEAEAHEVSGVGLDRTQSTTLAGDAGDGELQTGVIFGPANADIRNGDRITFPDGVIVEVDGIPDRSKNFFTSWRPPMSVPVQVTYG